jgi:hypothetical protein
MVEILGSEAEAPLKHYLDSSLGTSFISSDSQLPDVNWALILGWESLSRVNHLRDLPSFSRWQSSLKVWCVENNGRQGNDIPCKKIQGEDLLL